MASSEPAVLLQEARDLSSQTLIKVNDVQVIFNTDLKTALKLDDDDVMKSYVEAVAKANLLASQNITSDTEFITIERLETIDPEEPVVAVDLATTVTDGVEELSCSITTGDEDGGDVDALQYYETEIDRDATDLDLTDLDLENLDFQTESAWTSSTINLLISLRGELNQRFLSGKKKFVLWEIIARNINKIKGTSFTGKGCDDKWRNMVHTYRKNLLKCKIHGVQSVKWEFFHHMHQILNPHSKLDFSHMVAHLKFNLADVTSKVDRALLSEDLDESNLMDINDSVVAITEAEDDGSAFAAANENKTEKKEWTTEVYLMFFILKHKYSKVMKEPRMKFKVYAEIANKMNDEFGTDLTAKRIDDRWRNWVQTYESNLAKLNSQGIEAVKWKYFAIMDELHGSQAKEILGDTPRPGEYLVKLFKTGTWRIKRKSDSLSVNGVDGSGEEPVENMDVDIDSFELSPASTNWRDDTVKQLIFIRCQMEKRFNQKGDKIGQLWEIVAERLSQATNQTFTAKECDDKWRNLLGTYRRNLVRAKKYGTPVKWNYFWMLRKYLGYSALHRKKYTHVPSYLQKHIKKETKPEKYVIVGLDDYPENNTDPKPIENSKDSDENFSVGDDISNIDFEDDFDLEFNPPGWFANFSETVEKGFQNLEQKVTSLQESLDSIRQVQVEHSNILQIILEKLDPTRVTTASVSEQGEHLEGVDEGVAELVAETVAE
nr:PREDICTED: uncharacterized protein LOC109037485 [Bemisia tabaci]